MKAQGNQSGNSDATNIQAANAALRSVTQDLKVLQQSLIVQLAQDVARLQAEKARLQADVDRLRAHQQQLQTQQLEALSQRQIAQQQLWAKRLAEALATHLEGAILQRMEQWAREQPRDLAISSMQSALPSEIAAANGLSDGFNERVHHLLSSLDATLKTLRSLQQDFTSYEGLLPKQLSRMQDIEAQGKAILDALLARLDAETRRRSEADSYPDYSPPAGYTYPPVTNGQTIPSQSHDHTSLATQPALGSARVEPQLPPMGDRPPLTPVAPADSRPSTMIQGIWLMLISTLALSIHNVVVSIIGFGGKLFGINALQFGPYINLVIGNSLLILLLRMMVVVPCLAWVAPRLYPNVWKDLERFLKSRDRSSLWLVVGSGACLFVSQVLIYIAIAKIGAGVAVTILFMYPMFTIPLSWWLLGDRPTRLRWAVVIAVALGVILTALPRLTLKTGSSVVDILIAVASGIAFALYLITMGQCFKKQILHPVSLSLVQFTTILFLAATSLWLPLPPEYKLQVTEGRWGGILAGTLLLGILTLIGYLANNLGTKVLGPARTAIFSSAGPVLTAVLAFVLTPSPQSRLGPVQMIGILVVTLAVAALTQEKKPTPVPASTGGKR